MIVEKMETMLLKGKCKVAANFVARYMDRSVDSIFERNYGDGEQYLAKAEVWFDRLREYTDQLQEQAP